MKNAESKYAEGYEALRNLRIVTPCQAEWNEMTGDDREKFCAHCQKSVHDISAMTRDEAAALLAAGSNVCVRFYRDESGAVATADTRPIRRRGFLTAIAAGCAAVLLPIYDAAASDGRTVSGRVVGPAKASVAGARIELRRDEKVVAEAKSDGLGNFRFSAVPEGSYQMTVSAPGFVAVTQAIAVDGKSAQRVGVDLKAVPRLMGDIVAPARR